jgi:hypothetical protein
MASPWLGYEQGSSPTCYNYANLLGEHNPHIKHLYKQVLKTFSIGELTN